MKFFDFIGKGLALVGWELGMTSSFRHRAAVLTLLIVTALFPSATLADQCKLIVASRTTLQESKQLATEYSQSFQNVELLEAANGRFAISLGTLPYASGSDVSGYISEYGLPLDSFCMRMDRISRYIAFEKVKQRPRTVAPTENSFGMSKCPRGYKPDGFPVEYCTEIVTPPNAELDPSGNNWRCLTGYIRRGDQCAYVTVPKNAHLTSNSIILPGIKGWACNRGYREVGDECERVFVPENASLNAFGTGYSCNTGFIDANNKCRAMTYTELVTGLERAEQIALRLLSQGTGKSCSKIVDLCEDTCDDDFSYSSSPNKRECEKVCEAIEDNC
ncbi:hypothetical protein [Sulfitobacter sp. JL08]|uniref:hypothetical protein n=1 Tax=Sulfitobacter sp. JL08 TaxID=2070369 RepID=UPI0013B3D87D|nr:hypothetical protein [Sulfitobacter sp. JL08]